MSNLLRWTDGPIDVTPTHPSVGVNRIARVSRAILDKQSNFASTRATPKTSSAIPKTASGLPAARGGKPVRPDQLEYRIAQSRAEIYGALRLLYQTYRKTGLSKLQQTGMRVSMFNAHAFTDVFVAREREEVACTMSLIGDGELGLPIESVYPKEVDFKRACGMRLAEVGALAQRESNFSVLQRLIQLMTQRASFRRVDELLIIVHPRHAKFYQRFLAFESFGPCRPCDAVCGKPGVGLSLNLHQLRSRSRKAHDRMYGEPFPWETISVPPIDGAIRQELHWLAQKNGQGFPDSPSFTRVA